MNKVVFFLKASPPTLQWPADTKMIVLDPPQKCGGADPLCSTAYSNMYSSLKGDDGRVLPNLLKKYGVEGAQPSFVSFSAGHGFMNVFLSNDQDRAATQAVFLLDSTFGGGKDGYVKAAKDAALGKLLLVTATSDKGSTDALNNGDYAWREFVWKIANPVAMTTSPVPPMPPPGEGVQRAGQLWYYRYKDAEIHHWDMGKILGPVLKAHLLPYWSGATGTGGSGSKINILPVLLTLAGAYFTWRILSRKTSK